MLTRVYIDNFLCFVNFEYRPKREQLIFGPNGSGKSSLLEAVSALREIVVRGERVRSILPLHRRTLWLDQSRQTFELEAQLGERTYLYRLVLERIEDPPQPRILSETVDCDSKSIFEFINGEVTLYDDRLERLVTYPFDSNRSALETISPRADNKTLIEFKSWLAKVLCFRINPFSMGALAKGEHRAPFVDLSNFAAWYRHLYQSDPKQNAALLRGLKASLDSFSFLKFEDSGGNDRLLVADFQRAGESVKFYFNELSEGQRCLIGLYAILHFLLANGCTVFLDEPDNFISLREIQPWLAAVADAIEDKRGQMLIISHHPEIINQWAPGNGVEFVRDGMGPVRVMPFQGDPESVLSPAELVARGWEHA